MKVYLPTCPLTSGWHTSSTGSGCKEAGLVQDTALLLQRLIHYSPDLKNSLHTNCTAVIKQQGIGTNYSWVSNGKEEWDENNNKRGQQGSRQARPWQQHCLHTEQYLELTSRHQPAYKALDFISLWGHWGLNRFCIHISPSVLINKVSF